MKILVDTAVSFKASLFTFALNLVDVLLRDAVGEAEVYHLEDPVLAGPEHVSWLEISVDNALRTPC